MEKSLYTTVHPKGTKKSKYRKIEHEPNSLVNVGLASPFTAVVGSNTGAEYPDINGNLTDLSGSDPDARLENIVVGDGSTAVSYDDNSLVSRLGNGSASFSNGLDDNNGVARVTISGSVPNNSNAAWNVTEVGATLTHDDTTDSRNKFLFARDVIAEQTVNDGQQISVEFELEVP